MKKNIFTLLFGLLLAVGWTNVASAQALPQGNMLDRLSLTTLTVQKSPETILKSDFRGEFQSRPAGQAVPKMDVPLRANNKPDVVKPKSYYEGLTYSWVNPETGAFGNDVPATEIADDPYQIYELLRFVYKDKRFPGPYYSAYDSNGNRERQVYYGAVAGGWDIPDGDAPVGYDDIVITTSSIYTGILSIAIWGDGQVLQSWTTGANNPAFPSTWTATNVRYNSATYGYSIYFSGGGSITIPHSLIDGKSNVQVVIHGRMDSNNYTGTITVNGVPNSTTLTANDTENTWNIAPTGTSQYSISVPVMGDIVLTGTQLAYIQKIEVTSGGHVITSFDTSTGGSTLPYGWTFDEAPSIANDGSIVFYNEGANIIILSGLMAGYSSVQVNITVYNVAVAEGYSAQYNPAYVYVNNNQSANITSGTGQTLNWPVDANLVSVPVNNPNVYTPNEEGYTALIVVLNNNTTPAPQTFPENDQVNSESYFNTKEEIINYFKNNVAYGQLLTAGLRIGSGLDEGTVFNCSGTYNKFFFLGKGQARKKDDFVLLRQMQFGYLLGERAPFKEMFEEFSPTGGEMGSQITDFYIEMMDGAVYDVVHDCASVIDNGHQFSMSGNNGTQDYAMSGMDFFIPDYRLMYWTFEHSFKKYSLDENGDTIWYNYGPYTVDGRTMNPFKATDGEVFDNVANYVANWAQYYPQHAPKVGLYTLALDAEAYPVDGYDVDTNPYYTVTLDWTSSLNEMSGGIVPQTYEIYEVTYVNGVETLVYIATVTNDTHYTFPEPFRQGDQSKTHTYIIKGTPTTSTHPEFVAWSNEDAVVIPGLDDFLALGTDHYESDFDVPNVKNWYRNFLTVGNEDSENGLTYDRIDSGEDMYTLYRYDFYNPEPKTPVADIAFFANNNNTVSYLIEYKNQDIEPDENDKYELENMGIPVEGTLTVKAAGDIVIQPNGYDVNFLSIQVQAGNYNQTWTSSQTSLPNGWILSDGSMWVLEEGAYYLEGGYILIPASVLGSYSSARVTINGYGDPGKVAKITVNGTTHTLYNGVNNAQDYVFNIANSGGNKAPSRVIDAPFTPETALQSLVNNGSFRAPKRVVESHTSSLVFTRACGGTGTADDGTVWTVTSDASETTFDNTRGIHYGTGQRSVSYINLTTNYITGTIKKIVVNASGNSGTTAVVNVTVGGNAFGSQQSISSTATDYTFEGEASGAIVVRISQASARRALYCKSITVYYETGSEDPDGQVTIGDGTSRVNMYLPVYGSQYGSAQLNQMIYPANLLSSIPVGNQITSLTFYPTSYSNVSGLNFSGGKVKVSLGNTTISAFATAEAITPDDLTQVAEISNVTANSSMTAWTITFDTPFIYEGGNLLVQIETEAGTAGETYFASSLSFGDYVGFLQGIGRADFLPKTTFTYEEASVIPPTPSGEGLVRLDLQLVDQFSVNIPPTNDHPIRYGYVLKYEPSEGESKESGAAEVPVQHTGARVDGYYTIEEMLGDTDPTNFLTEDVLSAEVNMTLSGSSAPYYYTINSKKNAAPEDAWHNYVSVMQRRELGDYQEMNNPSSYTNPYLGDIYPAGSHEFFDFRKVVAESKDDYLTYVPIVWTKGIDRRYYVEDSLHNSYGAPIWQVHPGDVLINNSVVQRQARQDATGNWVWNNSVNYYVDEVPYSLYFVEVTATGVLPQNTAIEYEPYMFRIWLVDSTESLRDYSWTYNEDNQPLHIDDVGPITGAWHLLDTYMCDGDDDLVYSKSITTDYANNLQFAAPIENFHPTIMVRFYFKVKGSAAPEPSGMRGEGEDNVGHVTLRGTNPHDPSTGMIEFMITGEVVSKTYYNVQGMQSDKPFDGINIVVTRYSDGTMTTTKVVR